MFKKTLFLTTATLILFTLNTISWATPLEQTLRTLSTGQDYEGHGSSFVVEQIKKRISKEALPHIHNLLKVIQEIDWAIGEIDTAIEDIFSNIEQVKKVRDKAAEDMKTEVEVERQLLFTLGIKQALAPIFEIIPNAKIIDFYDKITKLNNSRFRLIRKEIDMRALLHKMVSFYVQNNPDFQKLPIISDIKDIKTGDIIVAEVLEGAGRYHVFLGPNKVPATLLSKYQFRCIGNAGSLEQMPSSRTMCDMDDDVHLQQALAAAA